MKSLPTVKGSFGVTGSGTHITAKQLHVANKLFIKLSNRYTYMNNGDCIHADEKLAAIWMGLNGKLVLWPPTDPKKRAFLDRVYPKSHVLLQPAAPYMDRNDSIVQHSSLIVATPDTMEEVLRSGTWSTVRRTRKRHLPLVLILPDGTVQKERC